MSSAYAMKMNGGYIFINYLHLKLIATILEFVISWHTLSYVALYCRSGKLLDRPCIHTQYLDLASQYHCVPF
jgi:hypothetical protein